MMTWNILEIITVVELFLLIFLVGALFYAVRKGFNQVVSGLESIDARLAERKE
jgi:hypothetical protein